jgi:signal transduction histidine kinase
MLRFQPKWLVLVEAFGLLAAIGWIDYVTAWEWSFFMVYAIPIILVVRTMDQWAGLAFAFLCAGTWWLAQAPNNPYQTALGFGLAVVTRLFYLLVLVVAVSALKTAQEQDRARISALERERELEREILRTSEREQQRIGQDLHDGLGPHLAAIRYAATFLASELGERGDPEAAKAEKIRDMAGEAVSLARGLARGIFPVQMDGCGLSTALHEFASSMTTMTGKPVTFQDAQHVQVDSPERAMHLYRIAQEAVNNAIRATAENVRIVLSHDSNSLKLLIADDGRGMDAASCARGGMGLHSMRYRANALGGELSIASRPNKGTTISCDVPLHPPPSTRHD